MSGQTVGQQFAHALAAKDFRRLSTLLHPQIDFRGLTPTRNWEASDADAVISSVFCCWFAPDDEIETIESIRSDSFADRELVGYRFTLHNPDGHFIVEQQAYLSVLDGRIGWMRVLCSGLRPLAPADALEQEAS
jgi:hypothetical protein